MSCWPLSESTRLAAVTAWTSVESTGLALAAVATGAVLMPSKLPAPSAGTCEQAAPNGCSLAALLEGGGGLLVEEPLLEPDASLEPESEPHAVRPRARVTATGRRAPRVRVVRFTGCAPCPVRATAGVSMSRGGVLRPAVQGRPGSRRGPGRTDDGSGRGAGGA